MLFRALVADKWYGGSPDFINGLDERESPYIVDLPHDERIFVRLPGGIASAEHRSKDVPCIMKPGDFRPVRLGNAGGTEREVFVAGLRIKIKKIPGKRRGGGGMSVQLASGYLSAVPAQAGALRLLHALETWRCETTEPFGLD